LFDIIEPSTNSSEQIEPGSEHLEYDSEHLNVEQEVRLMELAADARSKGKIPKSIMELTILELCNNEWLPLRTLARLLGRDPDSLRNHYINPMLKDGRLQARVPGKPNHPNQAYKRMVTP
jgi:ATP-dependent DNA helicase RecG